MKTLQEHRLFLENYYEEIKDLPKAHRYAKLIAQYPESKKYFDLLSESSVFCTAPWFGLNIHPAGKMFPCCAFDQKSPLGHLKENSIQEVRRGKGFETLKESMLSGKKIAECQSCYNSDRAGGENLRSHLKNIHEKYIPLLCLSEELPLIYLDVQFSNLCNLKCRICGPAFSSSWIADHQKLYNAQDTDYKIHSIKKEYPEKWNSVLSVIENVDEVYFWGGEPLMMPEHHEFLKRLIDLGKTNVKLRYSTNFSELEYAQSNTLDLWKNFKNLSVGASLDGSYERAELMRKGVNWLKVVKNRKRLMTEVPQARFFIACATSAYNILHIADFFKEWIELGYIGVNDFCVNLVYEPKHLSVQILPAEYKEKATAKIEDLIENFIRPRFGSSSVAEARFQAAINYMNSEDSQNEDIEKFKNYNISLDELRKENLKIVFPELQNLF